MCFHTFVHRFTQNPKCLGQMYVIQDRLTLKMVPIDQIISLPASVPIIPTFLYAMEHPSPEPQTMGPSVLPGSSTSSLVLNTPSDQIPGSPPGTSFSPLVSLFDNTTFSLQEVQTDPSLDPEPADLQANQTADAAVGVGRRRRAVMHLSFRVTSSSRFSRRTPPVCRTVCSWRRRTFGSVCCLPPKR